MPDETLEPDETHGPDPLTRAHQVQERASAVGFDWSEPAGALDKVAEELEEVRADLESGTPERVHEELGDLLFAVVNLARLCGSDSSAALNAANRKFTRRFERLADLARERGVDVGTAGLEALDRLWEEIKGEEYG